MIFSYEKEKLPEIYKRDGKKCYLDPIRKRLILITPEETVRQKWISFLKDKISVPEQLISVEDHLSHYGVNSRRRADIIIKGNDDSGNQYPLCIVECKAPDVPLTESTQNQVFDYCDEIGADYAIMSNGYTTDCYKYNEKSNQYIRLSEIPTYRDILGGKYIEYDWGEYPQRMPFEELKRRVVAGEIDEFISDMTIPEIALPAYNLLECFLDYRVKMPTGDYGMFKLIQDYGVRILSYGNHSGGVFSGPYRSFLIDVDGSTEIVSLAITTCYKSTSQDYIRTALCIAIDNEESSHHALQLVLDENLEVNDEICDFYHHGRIAIGNIGSGKISELRTCVEKYCPEMIDGKKFYLGTLINDKLWRLDDPEVGHVIANLISYALIRDKYRKYKKSLK